MATGILRANSIIGLEEEVTEGTFVAPSANTSYLNVLDGFGMKPARELIERQLVTASPGVETPRLGEKSVSGNIPVEFRASGVAGGATDFHSLFRSALGTSRQNTTTVTTKNASHSSTVIQIEDADISKFAVGDMVLIMQSGAHELRPVTVVTTTPGSATITLAFALTNGAPSNSVQINKFTTYYTAASGHPSLSLSYYWGNQIRQALIGGKVESMSLENFQAGKVAGWTFGLQGLNFTEVDGAAPHTPSYDSGLPPLILNACVWRDGVLTPITSLSLSLANTLSALRDTCSANGKTAQRVTKRDITGSINPYKDDTSTDYFDDWVAGTEFSLFAYAYNPSATTGEFTLGSVCGIWLPQCFTVDFETQDVDGVLVDALGFKATRGAAGSNEELYLSHQ